MEAFAARHSTFPTLQLEVVLSELGLFAIHQSPCSIISRYPHFDDFTLQSDHTTLEHRSPPTRSSPKPTISPPLPSKPLHRPPTPTTRLKTSRTTISHNHYLSANETAPTAYTRTREPAQDVHSSSSALDARFQAHANGSSGRRERESHC